MISLLIKNANIVDPGGSFNGLKRDIFIQDGLVNKIEESIDPDDATVVDVDGAYVGAGWVDSLAFCGEPGEEWKEDLKSLSLAAAAGGYTAVAVQCGNHPFPDSAAAISSILKKSNDLIVEILPYGTATKNKEGKQMAEIYDMFNAGAIAFFDGDQPITHEGLKSRIMEYANNCMAPFMIFPFNPELSGSGAVHEGVQSNAMGLKGIPSISENNEIAAAIELAKWLKTPLRLLRVSTKEAVKLIENGLKEGVEIHAAVPAMNLLFCDEDIKNFNENFKVMPPLRTSEDRAALLQGLLNGTLQAVCSNHAPQDTENKAVEFDYAAFGASTIQSAFSMLVQALGESAKPEIIAGILAIGNRKFLGLKTQNIAIGTKANLTVFNLNGSTEFTAKNDMSKGVNSPVIGEKMPGMVLGTVLRGQWIPAQIAKQIN